VTEDGGRKENVVASQIDACLAQAGSSVHLVGVGGVGMAGLAILLKEFGHDVSGCDLHPGPLAKDLARRGLNICHGHDPEHLEAGIDWIVVSTAVPSDHPELEAARQAGIPVFRRGHVLARLTGNYRTIAVCGTHGKTTTATFIVQMLRAAGRKVGWCIGGESSQLGAVASTGADGEPLMVVEADESDGTLAAYHPTLTVVTGIEFDHAEYYTDEAMLLDCFRKVTDQTTGQIIYCNEDALATTLLKDRSNATGYSAADGPRLEVVPLGAAAGAHNYLNAIAAVRVGQWAGLMHEETLNGLSQRRLPARRMECVSKAGGVRVISDYAHHPTEIRAVVETVRPSTKGRLLAVFQPHRYSRTARLGADFPPAFKGVDELVLVPVYAASEPPCPDGRVWSLYRHFREAEDAPVPLLADTLERAWYYLQRAARPGDTVLVLGAGDVERVADWAAACGGCWGIDVLDTPSDRPAILEPATPLASRTTFGIGGCAEYWGLVRNPDDLRKVLEWCNRYDMAFRTLGRGSNVLIGDCGVPGVVVRLDGVAFNMITKVEGGVEAGAAVPLARLVAKAEKCQFGDYSFLEGIPGNVGGALGMNAGAHGESISERIKLIHCLDRDGTPCIVRGHELDTSYRSGGMEGRIAIKAVLRPGGRSPEESARKRAEFAERRVWMKGLQCAGSIFKNPPDDHTGRLVEEAGLKGLTIGGASVSQRHGNLITATRDATASDVRALLEIVRDAVEERFGVRLETEVQLW
jgi:UDP-N-acetylenolpyruvoylglucosamine reductase